MRRLRVVSVVAFLCTFICATPPCVSFCQGDPRATEEEGLRTIGALRGVAPDVAVPILAELFAGERSKATYSAAEALRRIGPDKALPVLDAMLAGKDADQGRAAITALGLMGEGGLRRLVESVERQDEPLRWEASAQLRAATSGAFGDIASYSGTLWKHVEGVRSGVSVADDGFEQPARDALAALRQCLSEPDPARRIAAMVAMGWAGAGAREAVTDLARQLDDPSPAVRWVAVGTLGGIGRPSRSALPALEGALGSDDPLLRSGAMQAFGKIAPAAPEALAAAVRTLDDPDWHVREAGAEALGRAGRAAAPAVEALTARLEDGEPAVRAQAAHALSQIGLRSASATPRLVACLQDPAPTVRARAAGALAVLGMPEEALPALLADLGSEEVAPYGAIALLPPDRTVPSLVEALRNGDPPRRWAAALALGRTGPVAGEAVPALIDLLRSENGSDRKSARDAFAAMGSAVQPHMGAIVQVLEESDPKAQLGLVEMLAKMGGNAADAIPALLRLSPSIAPESPLGPDNAAAQIAGQSEATAILLELTRSDDPNLSRRAMGVLAHAGPYTPEVVRLLAPHEDDYGGMPWRSRWSETLGAKAAMAELVGDPDVSVRRFAVSHVANAPADPARAVPALIAALGDPEPDVRASAASGLLALATDAASAVEALTLATQDADEAVRSAASRALKVIASVTRPGHEADNAQRRLDDALYDLGHVDQATRQAATRELGRMGAVAVPALIEQLRSADRVRRYGAAVALRYAGKAAAPARPDLLLALNDPEKDVRTAVLSALAAADVRPEDLPLLLEGLGDADTRFAALTGLTSLGAEATAAAPRLLEVMRTDPLWTGRNAAMSALGALGPAGSEAEPYVREALNDPRWEVRERAMQVLLKWHPEDLSPVAALLGDPDYSTTTAALRCCAQLGPAAATLLPTVREALFGANPSVRVHAAQALFAVTGDTETTLAALVRDLRDEKPWRMPAALWALEEMGAAAEAAAPEVRRVLDHPDPQVRLAAAGAIWAITGNADEVVPSLVAQLSEADRYAYAAAKLLGKIGPAAKAAIPALEPLRYSRDDTLYRASAEAIAAIQAEH